MTLPLSVEQARTDYENAQSSLYADDALSEVVEFKRRQQEVERTFEALCSAVRADALRQSRASQARITALEQIVKEIAEWRTCEEERSKCEGDSGPYCSTHGENSLHIDLIAQARAALHEPGKTP